MAKQLVRKVPARYVGEQSVRLPQMHGPYFDAEGKRLTKLVLSPGDTLMVYEQEVRGQTFLLDDATGAEFLGYGRVVKPEHQAEIADKSDEEQAEILSAIGYQFHQPRSDFVEVVPALPAQPSETDVPPSKNGSGQEEPPGESSSETPGAQQSGSDVEESEEA